MLKSAALHTLRSAKTRGRRLASFVGTVLAALAAFVTPIRTYIKEASTLADVLGTWEYLASRFGGHDDDSPPARDPSKAKLLMLRVCDTDAMRDVRGSCHNLIVRCGDDPDKEGRVPCEVVGIDERMPEAGVAADSMRVRQSRADMESSHQEAAYETTENPTSR